jgi:hypothetical protein
VGGRKKQNKFPQDCTDLYRELNPFLFQFYQYRIRLLSFLLAHNVLALGAVADLASLIFNSEHKTVNTPQKLMRGRMFN